MEDALIKSHAERESLKKNLSELTVALTGKKNELSIALVEQQTLLKSVSDADVKWEKMRNEELPLALEQKVEALREAQRLRAEIEMLRKQIW